MNSMLNWMRGGLALLCFGLLFSAPTRAQETADLVGTVTDTSGAVVPGATVTLTNTGTNISQAVTSSGSGDYAFTLLQVGNYTVKVEAPGFKTFSAPGIALSSGDRARVDAKMEVGATSQTVEVTAGAAPALQTDTSTIGSLVTTQNVEELPLNQRNFISLIQVQPGIMVGSPGAISSGNRPDDRRIATQYSAHGQSDTQNNNLIDGMDNTTRVIGALGVRPSIDAIQEVNIQTNKFDASVGRTGGAVVDVITKSGSNSFHGSAYEFFRNKALNANPNYNFPLADNGSPSTVCPTVASCAPAANLAYRQNQYGGSMGGPIKKDKTFFFADYEILQFAEGLPTQTFSVPTLCERGLAVCPDGKTQFGDFSDQKDISPVGGGGSSCTPNTTIVAPGTCPYVVIPSASITPLGRAYFNMYPLPTNAGLQNNYSSAPVKTYDSNTWDGRIDHHFSDKDTIYFRWTHNGEHQYNPNGFPNVQIDPTTGNLEPAGSTAGETVIPESINYAGPNHETQEQSTVSYVHVFRPDLLLNLKFAVFRNNTSSLPVNAGKGDVANGLITPADGGWPCNPTSCVDAERINPVIQAFGIPSVSFTSINGASTLTKVGDSQPISFPETSIEETAGLTWNKGAHSIRFGLGLIRQRLTQNQPGAEAGGFTFTGAYTGYNVGDMLEGLALSMSRGSTFENLSYRSWEPSGYVQDDWRARPWLTLNLGVRYDIFTPFTEEHGRIANYDPYIGLIVSPAIPGAQQSNATAGVPTLYRDFAPRVGFAASLPHNTVLRGGFGITFYPENYQSGYSMYNVPNKSTLSCSSQIVSGTVASCASQQFDAAQGGTLGQFNSGVVSNYGLAATNASSTVGQVGGDLMTAGVPVPYLNLALATNTANYISDGSFGGIPFIKGQAPEGYMYMFNLELQKQIGANVFNIAYVGQIGRHVTGTSDGSGGGSSQNLPSTPVDNHPNLLPMVVGGITQYYGTLAGYPYFDSTSAGAGLAASNGTSIYNDLELSLVRRFSRGLTANFAYVWARQLDNVDGVRTCVYSYYSTPLPCWVDESNGTGPSLAAATTQSACFNEGAALCKPVFGWQKLDWGNGTLDVADRFTWGVNYDLPFGKSETGILGGIVKGWAVNTAGSWQTGSPFQVYGASNTSGITASLPMLDQIGSGHITSNSQRVCPAGTGPGARPYLCEFFNYNAFVHPVAGTLGNEEGYQLFGPRQVRVDLSLVKDFPIKEQLHLQFRTEVFNLFNQVDFSSPGNPVSPGNSANGQSYTLAFQPGSNTVVNPLGTAIPPGQINSMNAGWNPRQIQFALKLMF